MSEVLWKPSAERVARSALTRFAGAAPVPLDVPAEGAWTPEQYEALRQWSIDDLEGFWTAVWDGCGVVASERFARVLDAPRMPGARWFEGARLSFPENLLRRDDERPALIGAGEGRDDVVVSARELRRLVARAQEGLRGLGVAEGDRVAAFVPNCVEAVVLMLAATSLGALWSSCSPDFGAPGVVDRFGQIAPKVLVVADGYRYAGTVHSLQDKVDGVVTAIAAIAHVVVLRFVDVPLEVRGRPDVTAVAYDDLLQGAAQTPAFAQVAPDHPLYVLYSSGTTGAPKSIVHGHAGTLVTHLKEQQLHCDVGPDSTLLWFTTCGWMMWNWLVSALGSGAAAVLYDGSPTHPGPEALWELAERAGVTHFGTSPKFLAACAAAGLRPRDAADLGRVEAVLSTGSPLNPEQFDWVYEHVAEDVHLASMSGGTDLIGCFVGGVPTLPVRRGELQARALGMAVEAWDGDGRAVVGEKGELVCTRPFPSMPVGFWNDPDGTRYRDAYFAQNPGVWTHGDFVEVRAEGGVVIYGRSDTTLNPGGVRIGTAEIYRALDGVPEVADAIVVGRAREGDVEVVLCVKLAEGAVLDEELVTALQARIRAATTPRHVPRHVVAVPDVPYTISGKKVEKAVRTLLEGGEVDNRDALLNPEALDAYTRLALPA